MTNLIERINAALGEISLAISRISRHNPRIELKQLSQPYEGLTDGFIEKYYFTIFDLQSESGKSYRKEFWDSAVDSGREFDFRPTNSFRVKGRQVSSGETNGLEWYIIETNDF